MNQPPRAFVIGHPIGHSRSPKLHGYWLRMLDIAGAYDAHDVAPDGLEHFFAGLLARGYVGGNVTVPHKLAAMRMVAHMDEAAIAIGAVNTIWREGDAWIGCNTDAAGFIGNLDDRLPGWDRSGKRALILGAGGAARAAVYGLQGRGFEVAIANRTVERGQALASSFGSGVTAHAWEDIARLLPGTDLLINTTALGMQAKPPLQIDLAPLKPTAIVHDIVYVPLETALLQQAGKRGHRTVDGLGMLLHQAVPGFARWFGVVPQVTAELRALLEADIGTARM